jgi:hypothetical protein
MALVDPRNRAPDIASPSLAKSMIAWHAVPCCGKSCLSRSAIILVAPSETSMGIERLALGDLLAHDAREAEIALDDIGCKTRHRRLRETQG